MSLQAYLQASPYIDFYDDRVAAQARELADGAGDAVAVAQACFTFVRDAIRHSWDFRQNPVTCKASDVLCHGTGYCLAKSHLLAALLRANGIPAGLCYQRVALDPAGMRYALHGLNAVFLPTYGWYRCDARGNKPGIDAQFTPPQEKLAFPLCLPGECDWPDILAEPLAVVTDALKRWATVEAVYAHLPDATELPARPE